MNVSRKGYENKLTVLRRIVMPYMASTSGTRFWKHAIIPLQMTSMVLNL